VLLAGLHSSVCGQRGNDPAILHGAYTGLSIGYINYPFSNVQMETGFSATTVKVPHTAVRIVLFGKQFNRYVTAELSYLRPVDWVTYTNVNGDQTTHSVWMNEASVIVRGNTPTWKRSYVTGSIGLCVLTRRGFDIDGKTAVKSAVYGTPQFGAGVGHLIGAGIDLIAEALYSPPNRNWNQPHTVFIAAGARYHITSPPMRGGDRQYFFPRNIVRIGGTPAGLGYGVNNAVSKGPVPVFWGGDVRIRSGFSAGYEHRFFHTRKVFWWSWAVDIAKWKSKKNHEELWTLSAAPALNFTALRSKAIDVFFSYSVAGPAYISRTLTDDQPTGRRFTFQDYMGMGAVIGSHKTFLLDIRIIHYSNGNLFPENLGYMVPLTFHAGYVF
jgi:hypothetical protein